MRRVEGEVQFEDLHAPLAEKPQLTLLGVRGDERANVRLGHLPLARDARHLEVGRRGREVGIEPGGRGGDQIDRNRRARVLLARRRDVGFDVVNQLLVRRAELTARRIRRVVSGAGGRGPRAKVPGRRESLADDPRADDLSVPLDQLSVGVVGEDSLRDTRDRERIDDAEQQGCDDRHQGGGGDIAHDVHGVLQQTLMTAITPGEAR
jgi:hypothetical protein